MNTPIDVNTRLSSLGAGDWPEPVPANQNDCDEYLKAMKSTRFATEAARISPEWFRRGYIYQVQPRAFTREGTLKAATAKLPLVKDAGAGIVYLMPVNVLDDSLDGLAMEWHSQPKGFYRTKDYFHTDPEFGTDEDRAEFVREAHRLGMKVLFDVVFFHCGPSAVLIGRNRDWVEREADGSIRLGKWGYPALNFASRGLREYLLAVLAYLVADVDVDGFRCDVAETQPLDFWEEARRRLSAIKPDVVLICEGYGRPGEQCHAFDCCYDWPGKSALRCGLDEDGPISEIRHQWELKRSHCEKGARFLRFVENHDETDASQNKGPRGDSDERWGTRLTEAALFWCFTSDGVPFLFNGNEFADKSFQRMRTWTPIDWVARDFPEGRRRLDFVRKFAALRRDDDAFSTDAELRWIDNSAQDAVLSYEKVSPGGGSRWFCAVNLTSKPVRVRIDGRGDVDFAPSEWKMEKMA